MNVDTIPIRAFLTQAVPDWTRRKFGSFLTYTHPSEQWHVVVGLDGEQLGTVRVTATFDGRQVENFPLKWPQPHELAEVLRDQRVPDVALPVSS
jgi:hypothetical protein